MMLRLFFNSFAWSKRLLFFSALALASVILITYLPSLGSGFYHDDWWILEMTGRLNLWDYLRFYFDPNQQKWEYSPFYFLFIFGEHVLFGNAPEGYHLIQVAIHYVTSLLLFMIILQISRRWRLAFLSSLVYGLLPVYSESVFWVGVHDPMAMLFYLLAIWIWVIYLQRRENIFFLCSLVATVLALLSKENSATLPAALFLIDRLVVREKINLRELIRRYLPLATISLGYSIILYLVHNGGDYATRAGISLGPHMLGHLVDYLSALVFPWNLGEPWRTIGIVLLFTVFVTITLFKRSLSLVFIGVFTIMTMMPFLVLQLGGTYLRYLYAPAMGFGVIVGLIFEWVATRWQWKWVRFFSAIAITLLVFANSMGVASASADFQENARRQRVPFREIVREHPTFPNDTLLYFIAPNVNVWQITGIFFLWYGANVTTGGTHQDNLVYPLGKVPGQPAQLRDHDFSLVYYFDESGRPIQIKVNKEETTQITPRIPVQFEVPIQLEGYEVTSSTLKRGEPIALLLYWHATGKIGKDYTVFVHLIDAQGAMILGDDSLPQSGAEQTSLWSLDQFTADGHILQIPSNLSVGTKYRLEIGLYYLPTLERVGIVDSNGNRINDHFVIESFSVVD